MTKKQEDFTLQGLLSQHSSNMEDPLLFISSVVEPLTSFLEFKISNKFITVRYWITDKPCTKEEAITSTLNEYYGVGSTSFGSYYSEYTGYLWTTEKVKIGGHDLIQELLNHVGKWVIIDFEFGKK